MIKKALLILGAVFVCVAVAVAWLTYQYVKKSEIARVPLRDGYEVRVLAWADDAPTEFAHIELRKEGRVCDEIRWAFSLDGTGSIQDQVEVAEDGDGAFTFTVNFDVLPYTYHFSASVEAEKLGGIWTQQK